MARVDRSKRFDLTEQQPAEQRPQIWVDGRQQPRFRIGPYVAVSLAMAKRDLLPDMIASEARLRSYGVQMRAGEVSLGWLGRLGRLSPEEDRVAGWAETLASVVAGARARLERREAEGEAADASVYAEVLRRTGPARPQTGAAVRPRRAAEVLASAQKPAVEEIRRVEGSGIGLREADLAPLAGPVAAGLEAPAAPVDERPIGLSREDLAAMEAPEDPGPVAQGEASEDAAAPAQVQPEMAQGRGEGALDPDLAAIRMALESDFPVEIEEDHEAPARAPAPVAPVRVAQDQALPSWLKDWQPPAVAEDFDAPGPALSLPEADVPARKARPGLAARMVARLGPLAGRAGRAIARLGRRALRGLGVALRPIAAMAVNNLARLTHGAACWALLSLLMIIAVPKGAYGALVYHLDGGDLADWS